MKTVTIKTFTFFMALTTMSASAFADFAGLRARFEGARTPLVEVLNGKTYDCMGVDANNYPIQKHSITFSRFDSGVTISGGLNAFEGQLFESSTPTNPSNWFPVVASISAVGHTAISDCTNCCHPTIITNWIDAYRIEDNGTLINELSDYRGYNGVPYTSMAGGSDWNADYFGVCVPR